MKLFDTRYPLESASYVCRNSQTNLVLILIIILISILILVLILIIIFIHWHYHIIISKAAITANKTLFVNYFL